MKKLTLIMLALWLAALGCAQPPNPLIRLYPDQPDRQSEEDNQRDGGWVGNVHTPTLTVFLSEAKIANGTGVIICPGGGYGGLAVKKEGCDIARWFNSLGISAFVLKYRLKEYKHPIPLTDAQTAITYVRNHAKDYKLDPQRIGIMGFSAGGHLASSAGTHFTSDANRPDFMILIYPVISMQPDITHMGSRNNLLGQSPSKELVDLMSNELQVTKNTPPTFLVHTTGDKAVPSENSVRFYLALKQNGVPAEMHIYEKGDHGYGMEPRPYPASTDWPKQCTNWLKGQNLLADKQKP